MKITQDGMDITGAITTILIIGLFVISIASAVFITQSVQQVKFAKTECAIFNPETSNFEIIEPKNKK